MDVVSADALDDGTKIVTGSSADDVSQVAKTPSSTDDASGNAVVPWKKRRCVFVLLGVLVVAALGLVLFYLLDNDRSSKETMKGINSFPTNAPTSVASINPAINSTSSTLNRTVLANMLTSYINSITLSNQTVVANGTSPESKALAWMIAHDTIFDTANLTGSDESFSRSALGFRIRQRYPLLVMWFQQSAVAKWSNTTGWLVDPSECSWHGITCNTFDDNDGVKWNGGLQNVVTHVNFSDFHSYVGIIPFDAGLLSHLQHFEIVSTLDYVDESGKYLSGKLPESIGKWTALTFFAVNGNHLTGTLPDSISNWTNLIHFNVRENPLIGSIPDSVGQWTALTFFSANSIQMSGTLPDSIGNWSSLIHFDVYGNFDLIGNIPDSIDRWSALSHFDAGFGDLTGTLPQIIGQWTALTYFDVAFNALTGMLPESIGQWTALTFFNVFNNLLSGTIPISIGNWSSIEYADFTGNQFVGFIPNGICEHIDFKTSLLVVDCTVNCSCCDNGC